MNFIIVHSPITNAWYRQEQNCSKLSEFNNKRNREKVSNVTYVNVYLTGKLECRFKKKVITCKLLYWKKVIKNFFKIEFWPSIEKKRNHFPKSLYSLETQEFPLRMSNIDNIDLGYLFEWKYYSCPTRKGNSNDWSMNPLSQSQVGCFVFILPFQY